MQTAELAVTTSRRTQLVAIGDKIAGAVKQNGWHDGVLTVFVPHTTAGVTINENADPDVARDMKWFSDELIPQSRHFGMPRGIRMPISRPAFSVHRCS